MDVFDEKSQVWLKSFSLMLKYCFPPEIIYSDWFYWQEKKKVDVINMGEEKSTIECGSRVEGLCLPDLQINKNFNYLSDEHKDNINTIPDSDTMIEIDSSIHQGSENINMFTIEHIENDPRYIKLKLTSQFKASSTEYISVEYLPLSYVLHKSSCMADLNKDFTANFNEDLAGDSNEGVASNYIHNFQQGPAIKAFIKGPLNCIFEADKVRVLKYPSQWPDCAMEWLSRRRTGSWPSEELIKDIYENSCHIAPISRKKFKDLQSDENYNKNLKSLEWRISFSVAENKLAESILPSQRHILILLKFIKKLYFAEDIINTYHLKNIFYWEIESITRDSWNKNNTAYWLLYFLDKLQNALACYKLPHFIIPESNLFNNIDEKDLDKMGKCVSNARINIFSFVCNLFHIFTSYDYLVHMFNRSLKVCELNSVIQNKTHSDSYGYTLTLFKGKLVSALEARLRNYRQQLEKENNEDMILRNLQCVYVHASMLARLLCEIWMGKTELNFDKQGYLTFIDTELKGLQFNANSSFTYEHAKSMCQLYFSEEKKGNNILNGVPKALEDVRGIKKRLSELITTDTNFLAEFDFANVMKSIQNVMKMHHNSPAAKHS